MKKLLFLLCISGSVVQAMHEAREPVGERVETHDRAAEREREEQRERESRARQAQSGAVIESGSATVSRDGSPEDRRGEVEDREEKDGSIIFDIGSTGSSVRDREGSSTDPQEVASAIQRSPVMDMIERLGATGSSRSGALDRSVKGLKRYLDKMSRGEQLSPVENMRMIQSFGQVQSHLTDMVKEITDRKKSTLNKAEAKSLKADIDAILGTEQPSMSTKFTDMVKSTFSTELLGSRTSRAQAAAKGFEPMNDLVDILLQSDIAQDPQVKKDIEAMRKNFDYNFDRLGDITEKMGLFKRIMVTSGKVAAALLIIKALNIVGFVMVCVYGVTRIAAGRSRSRSKAVSSVTTGMSDAVLQSKLTALARRASRA